MSVQDLLEKLSVAIIEELEEILFTWHSKLLWLSHYEVSGSSVDYSLFLEYWIFRHCWWWKVIKLLAGEWILVNNWQMLH